MRLLPLLPVLMGKCQGNLKGPLLPSSPPLPLLRYEAAWGAVVVIEGVGVDGIP